MYYLNQTTYQSSKFKAHFSLQFFCLRNGYRDDYHIKVYRISPCIMRCFFLAIHVAKRHLVLYIDVEFKQIFSSLAVSSAVSSLAVERIGQSACLVSRPMHTIQQDCAFPTFSKQETFTQCWYIVGPPSSTLTQQCSSIG